MINECIIVERSVEEPTYVLMRDMEIGTIAQIVEHGEYYGNIVRRSLSLDKFCVDNLSINTEGSCWTYEDIDIKVKMLPNARLVVEL